MTISKGDNSCKICPSSHIFELAEDVDQLNFSYKFHQNMPTSERLKQSVTDDHLDAAGDKQQ